jgi:hypothetical protein
MDRRGWLAQLLTDDDLETLKQLAREGMGENSLRALASDLAYFADLGGRRHRPAALVAGDGGASVEIRGASSLGPGQARERSPTWDARGRRREPASGGGGYFAARAPCPKHRQAAACELERAAPLERDRGTIRCAEPALGRSRLVAAARALEQAGRHPGRLGSVDRDLRDSSSGQYPGSRGPSPCVRV